MKYLTNSVMNWTALGLVGLLVLLPFHALLTVWLGNALGLYDTVRIWKELLLAVLAAGAAYMLYKNPPLWHKMRRSPLFWLMGGYVLVHVILGIGSFVAGHVNATALLYGLIVNLRLVVIFWVAWVVASQVPWVRRRWAVIVLAPAAVVVLFGLVQAWVLPHDALRHVGYGPATIAPFQTVDQKPDYIRVQSTLRGANPLGAYLVVVTAAAIGALLSKRFSNRLKFGAAAFLLASSVLLGLTYSRSAYAGAVVAAILMVWMFLKSGMAKQTFVIAGTFLFVIVGLTFSLLQDNNTFQNIFFHTDETSQSAASSNTSRAYAIETGVRQVLSEPLGRGPGTAGPASQHNTAPARLAENYYLQIGQEVGWLGLGLFVVIIVVIAKQLWARRSETLPAVLFASLIGLTLVNVLSHAWTDDTLVYIWWALAGVALARPAILARYETH